MTVGNLIINSRIDAMNIENLFAWSNDLLSPVNSAPLAIQSHQDNFLSLQRELNRSLNNFYNHFMMPSRVSPWGITAANDVTEPVMDFIENGKEFRINIEAPGVDPNDITISTSGQYLTVIGKKKEEAREEGDSYIASERGYGEFSRTKLFPVSAKLDQAQAEYRNGILTVHVPKKMEPLERARSITITKQPEMAVKLKVRAVE